MKPCRSHTDELPCTCEDQPSLGRVLTVALCLLLVAALAGLALWAGGGVYDGGVVLR